MRGPGSKFRLSSLSLAAAILTGCYGILPWPTPDYASRVGTSSGAKCPDVSGIYLNLVADPKQCTGVDHLACERLSFYLLSNHVPEGIGVSNLPTRTDDWPPHPKIVEIQQPSNDVLRILVGDNLSSLQLVRELRADQDDFRCTPDDVHLKPRLQSDFIFAAEMSARRHNQDDRSLRLGRDRGLIVTSVRTYSTYWLGLIGGTMRKETHMLLWAVKPAE